MLPCEMSAVGAHRREAFSRAQTHSFKPSAPNALRAFKTLGQIADTLSRLEILALVLSSNQGWGGGVQLVPQKTTVLKRKYASDFELTGSP